MSKDNSNVIIENCQVVFSKEVLEYFKNIETEENKEWIEKYFQVLSDQSNINAEKFNIHHIRPCFTFKDNTRTKRKETKPLGDKFPNNLIKLSIYNHFFAHYYLWKIYNNRDSKQTFQRMCGQSRYKDNLTENELMNIAKLKEECARKNKTKEEIIEYNNKYNKSDRSKQVSKRYYENNKNKQSYQESHIKYHNSEKAKERRIQLNKRRYLDPITNNYYSHINMTRRIKDFENLYKNITINDLKLTTTDSYDYINWLKNKLENSSRKKSNRNEINEQRRKEYSENKDKTLEYKKNFRKKTLFRPHKKNRMYLLFIGK